MSNEEEQKETKNIKNTDENLKEDLKKEEDLKGNTKNSELKISDNKTLYSSSIQSSIKGSTSNSNSNEQNSSVQYIFPDYLQSSINTQNQQNCINNSNLINSQNQNENNNNNMRLSNNQFNITNPIQALIKGLSTININPQLNNNISPFNNSQNNNLIGNNNDTNQTTIFALKKEVVNFQRINSQQTLNLQNTFTKKAILNAFLSQKTTLILQAMINEAPKNVIEKIVDELLGTYSSIIKNKNGNYFCSDLFKICETKQRIIILKELSKTFSDDCNDKYATHPLQFLVEYSSCEEEYNLILCSFYDYNKSLIACLDPNGSFVIQKIIKHIPEKYKMRFNLIFISFITFIIKKKFGVINGKVFIDNIKNEEILNQVITLIIADFINIATNQFSNYFIQHILEKWCNTNIGTKIKKEIIDNFRILYAHKYGRHVCDEFFKLANNTDFKQLINALQLNIINNSNNVNNNNDKSIMIRIIQSLNNRNKNVNSYNNYNNQNQNPFSQNNNYNNNNNNNIFLNQLPLSLNNFGKKK